MILKQKRKNGSGGQASGRERSSPRPKRVQVMIAGYLDLTSKKDCFRKHISFKTCIQLSGLREDKRSAIRRQKIRREIEELTTI